jgi:sulfatase modifying factor 1
MKPRGGTTTAFWFGDEPEDLARFENVGDLTAREGGVPATWAAEPWYDGHVITAPLGSFPPNSFGLHDLGGNVREMCGDAYGQWFYEVSPELDPFGVAENEPSPACVRGGDFASAELLARSAMRSSIERVGQTLSYAGTRPGRELETAP